MKNWIPCSATSRVPIWALAVFLPGTSAVVLAQSPNSTRPNIVLIYADDLDADELGCTNEPQTWPSYTGKVKLGLAGPTRMGRDRSYPDPKMLTPQIDSLATDGATLRRFYITSPVCTPSRYTLLTGRLATRSPGFLEKFPPGSHATLGWDASIDHTETSLAKSLQQAGYRTGVVGKWHNFVRKQSEFAKDAILAHNPTLIDLQQPGMAAKMKANYERSLAILRDGYGWDFVERINIGNSVINLEWMTEGAIEFIAQSHNGPFFLYVSLPVPHGQYTAGYCDIAKLEPRATAAGLIDELPAVMPPRKSVYQRLKTAGISAENAMATHMDDAVGAVLKKLGDLNLRDNTLVLFISDHGSRGKNSCFESAAHVPAIASWPARIPRGSRVDSLIGNMDVAATLIEIAGGNIPDDVRQDSHSFLPQLLGKAEPPDWRQALLLEIGNTKAAVTKRWKYIANRVPTEVETKMHADAQRAAIAGKPRTVFWTGLDHHSYGAEIDFPNYYAADQLYELKNDLYETTNLAHAPSHATTLAEMKEHLRALVATLPHGFGEFKPATANPAPRQSGKQ
jgi:arylsulfatase A-like enzyme